MNRSGSSFSSRDATVALVRCFRQEIDTVLAPELQSEQARTAAAQIVDMMDHLLAAGLEVSATAGTTDNGSHADRLAEQAALERFETALHTTVEANNTSGPQQAPVTATDLQRYLDAQRPHLDAGEVLSVTQIAGGYSKDTWRINTSKGIQGHKRLVLRRDLPFGPGENTVTDEVDVITTLHQAGLPVPALLWQTRDCSAVGQPFLLFPELPGEAIMGDWNAAPEVREHILLNLARTMAQLHRVPVEPLLSPRQRKLSPMELVRDYVKSWQHKWQRRQVMPSTLMDSAYEWLLDNVPEDLDHASIVHGDISLRNTLIKDGQLVALLDWEFWHPGDPMEDLSYFRLIAEPWMDWRVFMTEYHAAGGPAWDERRANYYAVWRSVRNATTTTTAWHGFLSGDYAVTKAAYQGLSLYRFFLRDIARQLDQRGVK